VGAHRGFFAWPTEVGHARLGKQDSSFKPATGVLRQRPLWDPPRSGARAERLEAADAVEKVVFDGERLPGSSAGSCGGRVRTALRLQRHQSLRLRLDRGEIALAAGACYFCQTRREHRLPRNMYYRDTMLATLDRLEALERNGALSFSVMIPSSRRRYGRHRSRSHKH